MLKVYWICVVQYLLNNQKLYLTCVLFELRVVVQQNNVGIAVVAPISGANTAVVKSMVTHGVRRIIVTKDGSGKVGLRVCIQYCKHCCLLF